MGGGRGRHDFRRHVEICKLFDIDFYSFPASLKYKLWGECSRFRGEVKKVVRHSATAWYKLEQSVEEQVAEFGDRGHNQEETALMFKQRVEEYADESRFLRGPGVDEKASSIFSVHLRVH